MATKRKTNPFTNRKATVSVHRNGLSIEIADVAATDSGAVAKELLDMMRTLVQAGYEELMVDAGGAHGGAFGEIPDEDGIEDWVMPPEAKRRRIGFTL
ncbi:MAG: hypothetical protein ACO3FT_08890 [Ilumatobacteraceae bacterium]